MNTDRETELIDILRVSGWITTWHLYEASPHDSISQVRKTLRILHAAGCIMSRRVDENESEIEWCWIDTDEETA